MIRQILTASVLGAALISAAPAFAQDMRTITVSYADLNLGARAGAAIFDRRVDHAVASLCGDAVTGDLLDFADMSRCRVQARASVKSQMEQAYARQGARSLPGSIVLASR